MYVTLFELKIKTSIILSVLCCTVYALYTIWKVCIYTVNTLLYYLIYLFLHNVCELAKQYKILVKRV